MGALDQIVWPRPARILAIAFACLL
ncbi:lysis protein, partial [Pseudomonas sp. HMWF006]